MKVVATVLIVLRITDHFPHMASAVMYVQDARIHHVFQVTFYAKKWMHVMVKYKSAR
ncbi:MAG: hypothetical protein GQ536_05050 [Candidatus Aminicenantes bacterium]|nr:hypothetical protein [Candidatus Aminicenantes bacterium]